jgi:crotonobetainyl-CoA:carnitine CoA-transferase CaiB-like acyl-CoA transferase
VSILIDAFDIPGLPVKFLRGQPPAEPRAALLCEHNREVLREVLSLSDAEIAELRHAHILAS